MSFDYYNFSERTLYFAGCFNIKNQALTLYVIAGANSGVYNYQYVLCFMENIANKYPYDDTSVAIVNLTPDVVFVSVYPMDTHFTLQAGDTEIVMAAGESYHLTGPGTADKGISVLSNGSLGVQGLNRVKSSADLFSVRPTSLLSREYLAVTFCPTSSACQLAVVATANGTQIVVYFPYAVILVMENGILDTYGAARPLQVSLNELQAYQVQSLSDLTGCIITSNIPVAVFAGSNQTTSVISGEVDHMADTLPPPQAWGKVYTVAGSMSETEPDIVKIIATNDNTTVTVFNCVEKTFYFAKTFEYVEDELSCGGYHINASDEIVVTHIRQKSGYNPAMYYPYPIGLLSSNYMIYVPMQKVGAQTSKLFLSVHTDFIQYILLNGTAVSNTGWRAILGTDWSWKAVSVDNGVTLSIYSDRQEPFGGHLMVKSSFQLSVVNFIPAVSMVSIFRSVQVCYNLYSGGLREVSGNAPTPKNVFKVCN